MKRTLSVILSAVMAALLISGCQNDAGRASQGNRAGQQTEAGGSVVVVMDPSSEPEAGFDAAYGWGAGEHVHEPLVQSRLTGTNTDLTIVYDLATVHPPRRDGLAWTVDDLG